MPVVLDSTFMPVALGHPYLREAQEASKTVEKTITER